MEMIVARITVLFVKYFCSSSEAIAGYEGDKQLEDPSRTEI